MSDMLPNLANMQNRLNWKNGLLRADEKVSAYIEEVLIKARNLNQTENEVIAALMRGLPTTYKVFVWSFEPVGLTAHIDKMKLAELTEQNKTRSASVAVYDKKDEGVRLDMTPTFNQMQVKKNNRRMMGKSGQNQGQNLESISQALHNLEGKFRNFEDRRGPAGRGRGQRTRDGQATWPRPAPVGNPYIQRQPPAYQAGYPAAPRQATTADECFRCGVRGHFSKNCWTGRPRYDPSQLSSQFNPRAPSFEPSGGNQVRHNNSINANRGCTGGRGRGRGQPFEQGNFWTPTS